MGAWKNIDDVEFATLEWVDYTDRQPPGTERVLRPIANITDHNDQIREFHMLLGSHLTQIRDVP
jgi:hypothetical protein